jgi:hypothetical protein
MPRMRHGWRENLEGWMRWLRWCIAGGIILTRLVVESLFK